MPTAMVAELLRRVGWRDDEYLEQQLLQLSQLQPDQLQDPCSEQDVPQHQDFELTGTGLGHSTMTIQHGFSPVSNMQKKV